MPTIGHIHSSRLASVPPKQLGAEVDAGASDDSFNVMTFTEVANPDRAAQLAAPGWGRVQAEPGDQKAECAVMFRQSGWDKIHGERIKLTDKTFKDGQGHTHYVYANTAVLERTDNNRRLWVSVAHLPSSVEGNGGFAKDQDKRVAAWKDAVKGWHAYFQKRDKWNPYRSLLVADWNLDHKEKWVRDYIQDVFPGLDCRWPWPYDGKGTHGSRLIDATWATTNDGRGAEVYGPYDGVSDHRPYSDFLPI